MAKLLILFLLCRAKLKKAVTFDWAGPAVAEVSIHFGQENGVGWLL